MQSDERIARAVRRTVEDAVSDGHPPLALMLLVDGGTFLPVRVPREILAALVEDTRHPSPQNGCPPLNGAVNGVLAPPLSQPPPAPPPPSLSQIERDLIAAFHEPNELLTAAEICQRAGVDDHSGNRAILTSLAERGVLLSTSRGYRIAPRSQPA